MAEAFLIISPAVTTTIAVLRFTLRITNLEIERNLQQRIKSVHAELELLVEVFLSIQDSIESIDPRSLPNLERAIYEYVEVVDKLRSKLNFGTTGSVSSVIRHLKWSESRALKYITLLQRHRAVLNQVLNGIQLSRSNNLQAKIERLYSDRRIDSQVRAEEHRIRILDWLYQDSFDMTHVQVRNRRQANTCQWILRILEFIQWRGSNGKMLWGYGIPGAGKTYLSSMVIDHLLETAAESYGVAYIYFHREKQDQQTPDGFLSSLVKQLVCQMSDIPEEIRELHDKLHVQQKRPTLENLYAILLLVTNSFAKTFIICDALDECHQEARRKEFLPLLRRMEEAGMNLFITSREYPEDIQSFFNESALKIQILAKTEDITCYIEHKINESPRAKRLIDQAQCKEKVISGLTCCTKGMFLFAYFNVKHICQQTTSRQILVELEKIQNYSNQDSLLDATYDNIMEILQSQSRSCVDLAIRILSWLVKAKRVLAVGEIQTAVSIEPEQYKLEEIDLPDKATLLDLCAGLVTVDESSNTIRLAHPTVREYLLRKSVIPQDADFRLTMACVTFLSFDVFSRGACSSESSLHTRCDLHPFFGYAAKHMPLHLKECNEDLTMQLILRLLKNPGTIDSYLQAVYTSTRYYIRDSEAFSDDEGYDAYPKSQNPLHIAAALGHLSVARLLLEDADIEALDSGGRTAIHIASSEGHEPLVRLLLQRGANPFIEDNNGMTALKWAESKGQESVVRSMLQKRADFLATNTTKNHESWAQTPLKDGDIPATDNDRNIKTTHIGLSSKANRYKLESAIYENRVVHTMYKTNLAARQRNVPIEEEWTRKKEIGAGGFGVVFLEEETGGRLRAVKRLPLTIRNVDYSRELNTLAKLADHKHLFVEFLGWFEDSEFLYVAMEYVEYGDLSWYIKDGSARLKARDITSQLLEGLAELHERQICHRDLKPQNVLVACIEPIWVKIADFGISKREKDTNLRTQIGTGGYIAPEILGLLPRQFGIGRSYTNAVDSWALGCLVHEILTSELPFAEEPFPISYSGILPSEESSGGSTTKQIDMVLLAGYCGGTVVFPTGPLQDSHISDEGIRFLKRLLDPNPGSRMSPAEGLKSLWLLEEEN